jgi:hypothetical protein
MPKVTINDTQGLVVEPGSGLSSVGDIQMLAGLYSNNSTVTAAGAAVALNSGFVQLVESGTDGHHVKLPLAKDVGQIMIFRNVSGAAKNFDIRNNANNADVVAGLAQNKTAICVSTAAGDNWEGHAID